MDCSLKNDRYVSVTPHELIQYQWCVPGGELELLIEMRWALDFKVPPRNCTRPGPASGRASSRVAVGEPLYYRFSYNCKTLQLYYQSMTCKPHLVVFSILCELLKE